MRTRRAFFPRGTGIRLPLSPETCAGSPVYIQSVSGLSCIAAHAMGMDDTSGGRSPASIRAGRRDLRRGAKRYGTGRAAADYYKNRMFLTSHPLLF